MSEIVLRERSGSCEVFQPVHMPSTNSVINRKQVKKYKTGTKVIVPRSMSLYSRTTWTRVGPDIQWYGLTISIKMAGARPCVGLLLLRRTGATRRFWRLCALDLAGAVMEAVGNYLTQLHVRLSIAFFSFFSSLFLSGFPPNQVLFVFGTVFLSFFFFPTIFHTFIRETLMKKVILTPSPSIPPPSFKTWLTWYFTRSQRKK